MKVMKFTGHQLASSGIYDTALEMTQAEINAFLMAGGAGSMDALFAMIAQTESGWIAAAPHPAGTYLIVEEMLFRVTADISVGTAIRPGGNAARTTILDAMRDMIWAAKPVTHSPRCDLTVSFDFLALCDHSHWDSAADDALSPRQ
ncbi:MAG: hypothetical protein IJT29_03620 [Oscillospiraceae bacterium]|nr:hypothetical protein [Oscillospiraceae bacterium]